MNHEYNDYLILTLIYLIVPDLWRLFVFHHLPVHFLEFPVNFYPNHGLLSAGGIQIYGFKGSVIARQKNQADPVLEKYQFVPYISDEVSYTATKNSGINLKNIKDSRILHTYS